MAHLTFGFVVFPSLLLLDLAGPYSIFAAIPEAEVHLVAKEAKPCLSSDKFLISPTHSYASCPQLDVLCVPGGGGVLALMEDPETLDFLKEKASSARYVSSVCTGSLVLGAAGLLAGKKATTHWQNMELLRILGATPEHERVVRDGIFVTAAGVSAGIDMALFLTGQLAGSTTAEMIQLGQEYAPEPPFSAGRPDTAPETILRTLNEKNKERLAKRHEAALRAAARIGLN